jgi:hypothetical protein
MSNASLSSSRLFSTVLSVLHYIKVAAGDVSSERRGRIIRKVHDYVIEGEAVHKIDENTQHGASPRCVTKHKGKIIHQMINSTAVILILANRTRSEKRATEPLIREPHDRHDTTRRSRHHTN